MSLESTAKVCPQCATAIPADAPGGLCPRCAMTGAAMATDAGAPPVRSEPPTLPEVAAAFPQLQVSGLIGSGGMGYVFRVRQQALGRDAALKLLPRHLAADPTFVERFNREARTLARLSHPNIVNVYESGQSGGFCYLLMEFVDGANLRQAMRAGRFTPAQALAIIPRICDALQYAHTQGVLHRDIKPENILIDARGEVKIADFGIAKLVDDPVGMRGDITLTQSGVRLGTPHYMAPEQIEKPADVDHRADIYSLGVVFYELLTGELPLGRFPAPSEKAALDARIDDIVFRALAKERDLRQQSAGEVRKQVEGLGEDPAPLNRSRETVSGPPSRSRGFGRTPWFWLGLGFACFLLGLFQSIRSPGSYVAVGRVEADTPDTWRGAQEYFDRKFRNDFLLRAQPIPATLLIEVVGSDSSPRNAARRVNEAVTGLLGDETGRDGKIRVIDTPVPPARATSNTASTLGFWGLVACGIVGLVHFPRWSEERGKPVGVLRMVVAIGAFAVMVGGMLVAGINVLILTREGREGVPPQTTDFSNPPRPFFGGPASAAQLTRIERFASSNEVRLRWEIRAKQSGRIRLSFLNQSQDAPLVRHQLDDYRGQITAVFRKRTAKSAEMIAYLGEDETRQIGASKGQDASVLLAKAADLNAGDLVLQTNTPVWLTHFGDVQVILELTADDSTVVEPVAQTTSRGQTQTQLLPMTVEPSSATRLSDDPNLKARIARNTKLLEELDRISEARLVPFLTAVNPVPELSRQVQQRNDALQEDAKLRATFGSDHPELVRSRDRLKRLDEQMAQTVQGIVDGIRFNLEADKAALAVSSEPDAETALARGLTLERSAASGPKISTGDLARGFQAANEGRGRDALRTIEPVVSDSVAHPDKEYIFRSGDQFYEINESKVGGILALKAILAAEAGDAGALSMAQLEGGRLWSGAGRLDLYRIRLDGATDQNWDEVGADSSELLALKTGDRAKVTVIRHFKEYGKANTTNRVEGLWIADAEPASGKALIHGVMNAEIPLERGKPVWVSDAISSSGLSQNRHRSNLKKVTVVRRDSTRLILNLEEFLKTGDRSKDLRLKDGDQVEVPEKAVIF